MSIELKFFETEFGSPLYAETVHLRDHVLRKPLNLEFSVKDIGLECEQNHLVATDINGELLACLVMVGLSPREVKMRQVAVTPGLMGKGIGSKLVGYSENWASRIGFREITLNARDTAVPFYKRLGYEVISEKFTEVGIPHFKMRKKL